MKITLTLDGHEEIVNNILNAIAHAEYCSKIGHTTTIGFDCDGDGPHRLSVECSEKPKPNNLKVETKNRSFEKAYRKDN